MSEVSTLAVQGRERAGKGAARATRRAGLLPGVIYGDKQPPTLIALDPRLMIAEINRPGLWTRLFDITMDGKTQRALCQAIQKHPVNEKPIHVDFLRVSEKSEVHVDVPVKFVNEEKSPGLKRGGVLNVVRHDVEVTCLANNIPSAITVDLTGTDIGDSIHISSITLGEGVRPTITDRDFTIATIAAPTVAKAEEEGEGAEEEDRDEEDEA